MILDPAKRSGDSVCGIDSSQTTYSRLQANAGLRNRSVVAFNSYEIPAKANEVSNILCDEV